MYKIRLGYGCGIKATLLSNGSQLANLRKARYIGAVLVLPDGQTMECADVSFDEVTQAVYVRLLPDRELTNVGTYGIVFNAATGKNEMYSSGVVNILEVSKDAELGYSEITISVSTNVVNFPRNVAYTGASPKISDHGTWLVYDDEIDAYRDTGVDVGYNNLITRYDQKFAEFVTPAIQATDAANQAAKAANDAAANAGMSAGNADAATQAANTAAGNATAAATQAQQAATNAGNKATEAQTAADNANNAATAANNAAQAANDAVSGLDDVLALLADSDCDVSARVDAVAKTLIDLMTGKIIAPKMIVASLVAYIETNIVTVSNHTPDIPPRRAGLFWIVCGEGVETPSKHFSKGNSNVSDWVSF